MKHFLAAAFVAATMVGTFAVDASAQTVMRLGLVSNPGTPEYESAQRFAALVAEKTENRYRVDVLHSGQAGGEREIAESVQFGTVDFGVLGGILQNFDPALMVVEWDLLFKNDAHVRAAMEGEVGDAIDARLSAALGAQRLATFVRTPRLLTTSRPVETLADLRGMKIRVPEMQARLAIWRALGAQPTPMAFPEVVPALQLGTIDGQENPVGLIEGAKIYEANKYLADTRHLYGFIFLLGSEATLDGLPEEDRALVVEAATEASRFNDEFVARSEAEQMADIGTRMTITTPDMAPWREAASEVYREFATVEGFLPIYEQIVELGKNY